MGAQGIALSSALRSGNLACADQLAVTGDVAVRHGPPDEFPCRGKGLDGATTVAEEDEQLGCELLLADSVRRGHPLDHDIRDFVGGDDVDLPLGEARLPIPSEGRMHPAFPIDGVKGKEVVAELGPDDSLTWQVLRDRWEACLAHPFEGRMPLPPCARRYRPRLDLLHRRLSREGS